jgi:hypothetical protein
MKTKFVQIKDNEWFYPTMTKHKMKCCDCGLVHVVDFRIVMRAKRLKNKSAKQIK